MLTATGYIAGNNWSSGNLLYTNPEGVRSKIINVTPVPMSTTPFGLKLIEKYPTGVTPDVTYSDTDILCTTRSDIPLYDVNVTCRSYSASEVRVCSSGAMHIVVNYINVDRELTSWPGYNTWLQNGR